LRETAERAGAPIAKLVNEARDIEWDTLPQLKTIAITAGASAPDILVEGIVDAFAERYDVTVETITTADETMFFPLPRELREKTQG
jgi:4-hydroxy-3-methylbut-2-enyl diphosphate reductase